MFYVFECIFFKKTVDETIDLSLFNEKQYRFMNNIMYLYFYILFYIAIMSNKIKAQFFQIVV